MLCMCVHVHVYVCVCTEKHASKESSIKTYEKENQN